MTIAKIEANARRALSNPALQWLVGGDLPAGYRDNPKALRSLLAAAAEQDPKFASSQPYKNAHAALLEVSEARGLRDRIAAAYHDPRVQRAAGDRGIDWYLQHPAAIREALRDPKIAAQLGVNLAHEIGVVAVESQQFMEANGIAEPAVAEAPISSDVGKAEAEIAELRTKAVTVGLTKTEDARRLKLYEARIARETGAEAAAPRQDAKKPAGEFERLIGKSVGGKLSPDENARLNELAGERAVETGQITREDLNAERDQE